MTNKEIASTVDRYLFATIGMFLSAVGIAMTIVSNIGTAPLSCPSYVMNLRFPAVSVGTWTLIVNCTYMLIQLALLRKQFKAAELLQVVASAIFGYMIDISLAGMGWLNPSGMPARIGVTVLACFISAIGVSMEVIARAWMLSAEMTAAALAKVSGKKFSSMKIAMDCTVVALSILASLLFFRNPWGDGQYVVIGIGTVLCAVLIGLMMKLTDPLVARLVRRRAWNS